MDRPPPAGNTNMAYLDALIRAYPQSPSGVAALMFPAFEIHTPQYPNPNPYELANSGYRRNEIINACINKRMKAVAEAPLNLYRRTRTQSKTPKELEDHPLRLLLQRPNPYMSEKAFWRATEMFLQIAGFAVWEKERNNLGEVIALWPMSPHWCAFRRGEGKPIALVEYRPWGIQMMPVRIENVVLFQYLDPLYPLLRALSPSAVAGRVGAVDNNTTDFLKLFMERGAVVNGLLSTERELADAEAQLIRKLWGQQHGGWGNWTDPAVLGYGVKYQQMQMDFRQMQFDTLDGRDEARLCQSFEVPPILVGAKIGLDRATYANYGEARKAFYEETITPEWDFLEAEVQNQLLGDFEDAANAQALFFLDFDIANVHALQEDRTAKFTRSVTAFEKNLLTRDEAREEMGFDSIDEEPIFSSDAKPAPPPMVPGVNPAVPPPADGGAPGGEPGSEPPGTGADEEARQAAQIGERKQFRLYAAKRLCEGAPERVSAFQFKFLSRAEQKRLISDALAAAEAPGDDSPENPFA